MIKQLYILSFIILTFSLDAFTQESQPDTSIIIRSFALNPETNQIDEADMDTTFKAIHDINPIYYHSFSNTFLGNTGQAAVTNNLSKRELYNPFMFSKPYRYYIYDPYTILHYNTRKPFTELKYLTSGSRDDSEQILSALHTQNVNQYVNVGIFYDLIASKGIYIDQNTGLNRLNLFGSYNKDDYSMYTSIHYNGFKFQENGGLENLENFKNRESEALNYAMNLDDANSRYRNLNLFYTHKLNMAALSPDSITKVRLKAFSLQHTINYQRYTKIYTDDISLSDTVRFYENNYYLTGEAYDSAFHQNLLNQVDLNIKLGKNQQLKVYAAHEFKTFRYTMPVEVSYEAEGLPVDTVIRTYPQNNYNDISIGGIYNGKLKNWEYAASGRLYLTGYKAGDLNVDANFTRFFNEKTWHLTLAGKISTLTPSYFLQNYGSAHFVWNNNFKNIDNTSAWLELGHLEDFKIGLYLNYYTGYIFFNQDALPEQKENQIFTTTFELYKKFTWGPVNHTHKVLLQKGADEVINIPFLAYQNSTWYENQVFNKVLKFRIGFDFYYFTSYFADAFMPATGMFYNQAEQEIGNYPFLDAFLDVKLKRTRFTIQYTNALSEFTSDATYFMAYRNPNFNGTLKFGIAWTFYN
ncbi:MAG: putative porin [Bacteroidales bacterium]